MRHRAFRRVWAFPAAVAQPTLQQKAPALRSRTDAMKRLLRLHQPRRLTEHFNVSGYGADMNTLLNMAIIIGGIWLGDQLFNHGHITVAVVQVALQHLG